jgi:hypothetical protein
MKNWSVTIRNNLGKREVVSVVAADRSAVFKECESRGIVSIIRIEEITEKKTNSLSSTLIRSTKIIALACLILGVVLFLVSYFSSEKKTKKINSIDKPVRKIAVTQTPLKKQPTQTAKPSLQKPKEKTSAADTNIVWISKRRYIAKMKNGTTKTVIVDDPDEKREPPIFKSGVNNFLTNFMIPGEPIPPTPFSFTNEEVLQALMEKIEFNDEDTENIRYAKESILLMRKELKETIENGGTLSDYIDTLQRRQDLESAAVSEARQMIMNELRNESPARAKELYDNINKYLNEKGIPNLRLPKKFIKIMNEGAL